MDLFKTGKKHKVGALFLVALLGGAAGFAATARRVEACSCVGPEWSIQRTDVTSSDPNVSHEQNWPEVARLSAYIGLVTIQSDNWNAGSVHYLSASE